MIMLGTYYGEEIAPVVAGALIVGVLYRWFWAGDIEPDPWESTEFPKEENGEEEPICQRCLRIIVPGHLSCPNCGAVVNSLCGFVPMACYFAIGDAFRSGIFTKGPLKPLLWWGYSLMALAILLPFVPLFSLLLAPVYMFFFVRNRRILSH